MPGPLRFFCSKCRQLITIGSQMAGKIVVCPQCRERLSVPRESDSKADEQHRRQKERRRKRSGLSGVFIPPPSRKGETTPEKVIDHWLEGFWDENHSVPNPPTNPARPHADSAPAKPPSAPVPASLPPFMPAPPPPVLENPLATVDWSVPEPVDSPEKNRDNHGETDSAEQSGEPEGKDSFFSSQLTPWQRAAATACLYLLIGFIFGIAVHSEYVKMRTSAKVAKEESPKIRIPEKGMISVEGILLYRPAEGSVRPDVDSVVILLPLAKPPAVPFSPIGLGVEDVQSPQGLDTIRQIEESGGACVRTDADGRFTAILSGPGDYLFLRISAHCQSGGLAPLSLRMRNGLERFFKKPEQLFQGYAYVFEEKNFTGSTEAEPYIFRQEN